MTAIQKAVVLAAGIGQRLQPLTQDTPKPLLPFMGVPLLALILLGLDLDEFSMSSLNILQIKKMIRSVNYKDAQMIAKKTLSLSTGKEVEEYANLKLRELAPQVFEVDNQGQK